jgi:Fe-S oxidoreductase
LARVRGQSAEQPRQSPPDVVFYTGCNILKTPHIALLCLDVLDLLGVDYEVMGGPGQCCGVYQFREGDFENTARVSYTTIDGLASAGTSTVLSWCPSCQVQIGEVTLPSYEARFGARPFDLNPFLVFLAERAETLAPMMKHRVEKRVALHERPVLPSVQAAVRKLLAIIPGVELIEIDVPRVGTQARTAWRCCRRSSASSSSASSRPRPMPASRHSPPFTMRATASFAMSATGAASRSSISWRSSAKGSASMPRISTSASR